MTKNYTKMQVGNFRLHARKFRLAGLFVNRKTVHKKKRFVVKRAVFSAESYKVTKLHLKNQGIRAQREDESEPNGRGTYTYQTSILNVVPFPTSDFRTWIFP